MATSPSKWIQAISVLIELTQQGKLRWRAEPPVNAMASLGDLGVSGATLVAYKAPYKEKWFRLERKKSGSAIGAIGTAGIFVGQPFSLEIIDSNGALLFSVPESTGLSDLYQAIQYQVSGVNDLVESLLAEKGKS